GKQPGNLALAHASTDGPNAVPELPARHAQAQSGNAAGANPAGNGAGGLNKAEQDASRLCFCKLHPFVATPAEVSKALATEYRQEQPGAPTTAFAADARKTSLTWKYVPFKGKLPLSAALAGTSTA
ncbi:hypothetical protein MMC29_003001, partial [Sticta canariensis]|nr:hypothetical protein [Sticta canariensis]